MRHYLLLKIVAYDIHWDTIWDCARGHLDSTLGSFWSSHMTIACRAILSLIVIYAILDRVAPHKFHSGGWKSDWHGPDRQVDSSLHVAGLNSVGSGGYTRRRRLDQTAESDWEIGWYAIGYVVTSVDVYFLFIILHLFV